MPSPASEQALSPETILAGIRNAFAGALRPDPENDDDRIKALVETMGAYWRYRQS